MERVLMLLGIVGFGLAIPVPGPVPDDRFCVGKPNGNYEYPAPHCSYFYQCDGGYTFVLQCPFSYLYYNPATDQCDWSSSFPEEKQAECRGDEKQFRINIAAKIRQGGEDPTFCRGKENGNYEHPAPECHRYYACGGGHTYVMSCPSNELYYNPANDQCDWPRNLPEKRQAECEGREFPGGEGEVETKPSTLPPTQPPSGPTDPFCQDKADGNYEYPAPNCSLYYACSGQVAYVMKCGADNLYYNVDTDSCDWAWNFPEQKRAECEGREYTGEPEGETRPPEPATTTLPSQQPSNDPFCQDKADGNYEYPAPNCSLYYSCSNGLTYIMKCASDNTYYNQEIDRCDWSWNFPEEKQAKCQGREYTGEPGTETEAPEPIPTLPPGGQPSDDPFCQDKADGNYEYPAPNCSLYYSCSNGLTYIMECGDGGLYYNKSSDQCDWAYNFPPEKQAECEGRSYTDEPVVEQTTDEPVVEQTTDEPISGEQTDEPIGEQTDEPIDEQTDEPIGEQTDEPISELTDEPIGEQTDELIDGEQTNESINKQHLEKKLNKLKSKMRQLRIAEKKEQIGYELGIDLV